MGVFSSLKGKTLPLVTVRPKADADELSPFGLIEDEDVVTEEDGDDREVKVDRDGD